LLSAQALARRMRAEEKARLLGRGEKGYFLPTGWRNGKPWRGGKGKGSWRGVGWPVARSAKEITLKRPQAPPRFRMLGVEY